MDQQQAKAPYSGVAEAFFYSAASYGEVLQRLCAPDTSIVFFDFETTGIDKTKNFSSAEHCGYPVQIGLVRIQGGVEVNRFNKFMNPRHPLMQWCEDNLKDADGNPLTNDWLETQQPWEDVLLEALDFIGDTRIVGGQNCQFDVGVMLHSLRRMREPDGQTMESRWKVQGHIDSLYLSQVVMKGQPTAPTNYKLETLAKHFGLPEFSAHDAAADCLASWHVLLAALRRGRDMQEQGAWPGPALPPLLTPNVLLSAQQAEFQELALQGHSMFITGGAGTGKSFLLGSIATRMQMQRKPCVVLSPTAAAAVLVKGLTIHSFFSIAIPRTWDDFCRVQHGRNLALLKNDRTCIVIDEISMVSAEMMDLIDANVRAARGILDKPFGGLQVLMFGDFYQLPPVVSRDDSSKLQRPFTNAGLAFESYFWHELRPRFCNLESSFRQRDDQPFLDALNRIRVGVLNEADKRLLTAPKPGAPTGSGSTATGEGSSRLQGGALEIVPTKLFAHKLNVQKANDEELQKLPGPQVLFRAADTRIPMHIGDKIQPPAELRLKVGAQVMLVKNLDVHRGLVNGTRGVVVGFQSVGPDTTRNASSPVSSPQGPTKKDGTPDKRYKINRSPPLRSNEADLAQALEQMTLQGDSQAYGHPIVRFQGTDEPEVMGPLTFEVGQDDDGHIAFRRQVPLTLAWAFSIHKSQGMSISDLEVSCSSVWEAGQLYVALSRARTLQGLHVRSLGGDGFCRADPRVVAFYAACERGDAHSTMWADRAAIDAIRLAAVSFKSQKPAAQASKCESARADP